MASFSIETEHLKRVFRLERIARRDGRKYLVALEDLNIQIKPGELFGLLGPNGAGKTTLIRILCTLLTPTGGRGFIDGLDVVQDVWKVRRIINMVSGGETCGYGILTPTENLRLFTELYGIPWKVARPRVEYMLGVVGLDKFHGSRVNKLSTGMRQRLNFARGFTTDPKVLFLDEPTIGLDVHSARRIRSFVKEWLQENPEKTVLLTTHYMAEAEEMCDRVAIIDQGRIIQSDTPAALKKQLQKETAIEISIGGLDPVPDEWQRLDGVVQLVTMPDSESQTTHLRALVANPDVGGALIRCVSRDGRHLIALRTIEPTLEDVFIKLTGRTLAEAHLDAAEESEG